MCWIAIGNSVIRDILQVTNYRRGGKVIAGSISCWRRSRMSHKLFLRDSDGLSMTHHDSQIVYKMEHLQF